MKFNGTPITDPDLSNSLTPSEDGVQVCWEFDDPDVIGYVKRSMLIASLAGASAVDLEGVIGTINAASLHSTLNAASLAWNASGHTGLPLHFAAFSDDPEGEATQFSAAEAAALIQPHLDSGDLYSAVATAVGSAISAAATTLVTAYTAAIATAVSGLSGDIDAVEAAGIAAVAALETEIADVATAGETAIDALRDELIAQFAGAEEASANRVPSFSGSAVEWMAADSGSPGGAGIFTQSQYFVKHFQEDRATTYDTIRAYVNTVQGAGKELILTLHSEGSNGLPDKLLWYSTSSVTTSTGAKVKSFASDGTWTADGAAFKDGSNRLRLKRGITIFRGVLANSGVNLKTVSNPKLVAADSAFGHGFHGFIQGGQTYPTPPNPASATAIDSALPTLPMTRV